MKIQCDVCERDEALVFCTADEAALCKACDHRVHHANKLASKHQRFSLIQPPPKQFPLCDVCLERRAYLFCQQDRASLCGECDRTIHSANEHIRKHNRFLLTGVKLSVASTSYLSSASATVGARKSDPTVHHPKSQTSLNNSFADFSTRSHLQVAAKSDCTSNISVPMNKTVANDMNELGWVVGSSSSIAEYLMETLPGWHVDDFLDSSCAPTGISKNDGGLLSFWDTEVEINSGSLEPLRTGVCLTQAPASLCFAQMGELEGFNDAKMRRDVRASDTLPSMGDDAFIVPQISPPSGIGSKRSRPFWW